jgi:hypothetical protein
VRPFIPVATFDKLRRRRRRTRHVDNPVSIIWSPHGNIAALSRSPDRGENRMNEELAMLEEHESDWARRRATRWGRSLSR